MKQAHATTTSTTTHRNHVWVRQDLVEAILTNQGQMPKQWKPRKRHRGGDDSSWGWCRAVVNHQEAASATDDNKGGSTPFGGVALRTVSSPNLKSPSWKGSPAKGGKQVAVTVTIEDEELAPSHLQNATVRITYKTSDDSMVCTANVWWLTGDEAPMDLTALEQLHEPAVVFCLQRRYEADQIYTYTGKVLLALNPFRVLDDVYGPDVMELYWSNDYTERPPPHIYATAEDAYRSMLRNRKPENQSILVSGESGAGKTVTTKIIMRYLATLSQRASQSSKVSIEAQVLQSNPILESFGNARTMRNDNSSRFGKFIEIRFDTNGTLVSASVETYLLEKVRLISQTPGERNYHIFYEVLAALPEEFKKDMGIAGATPEDFLMTASSGTYDRRDGVSDEDTFLELRTALDTVGFSADEQMDLFTVVCGLLHASNLTFQELEADASALDMDNPHLMAVCVLLGFEPEALNEALCKCLIEAAGDRLYKHLPKDRAIRAVEAFIKATYGALFTHIVRRVNTSIAQTTGSVSIGVLDIFGFETFETNSLEQLCINYCNEALQQQFNRFVFTLEQQEYQKEGIDWSFIEFPDNQDVLDLIDSKRDGILSILDEQCRLSRCTDKSFALTVYDKCRSHPRCVIDKHHEAQLSFAIKHYAGLVEYDSAGFIEKNKDELPKETTELLKSSSHPFVAELGQQLCGGPAPQPASAKRGQQRSKVLHRSTSSIMRESVGIQFASQLKNLRTRIESTSPHYVRCLKPNEDLIPHHFDHLVIADQLRCAGVLEAIRVSRIGFPHRYFHQHFCDRYGILSKRTMSRFRKNANATDICQALVDALGPQLANYERTDGTSPSKSPRGPIPDRSDLVLGVQMGKSKVFLRLKAFEVLELLRNQKLNHSVVKIQSTMRMHMARTQFTIALYAVTVIQRCVRDIKTYRIERQARIFNSACRIQNAWRCHTAQSYLLAAYCIAWWCQSTYRGCVARQLAAYKFLDRKAAMIQKAWKFHTSSRAFRKIRRAVISVQTRHRCRTAFRQLCDLRREARDLAKVAAERDKLRQETERLRRELEQEKKKSPPKPPPRDPPKQEKTAEVKRLRDEVHRLKMELEKAHRMAPSPSQAGELQKLIDEVGDKENQLQQLRTELMTLRSRDDNFSTQSSAFKGSTKDDDPFLNKSLSPIRSDVSLLDTAVNDGSEIMEPPVLPEVERVFSALSYGTSDSGSAEEIRHLHNAIRQKNIDLLTKILAQATDTCVLVNEGDKYGRTALHHASISGDVGTTSKLLDLGAIANAQDEDGETPLHLAETHAMTILLVEKGRANPNIPNIDGICAIHLSVQRRDLESVRTLLSSNANVNNADNVRWFTPLHLIALPSRNENDGQSQTAARIRIAQLLCGSLNSVKPDMNYQDREGNTPLHYAVQIPAAESCDIVGTFLEKGADPNISNERNQTPLHLLCHNNKLRELPVYQETLHTLLFHGADPNVQSLTGCTALHLSLYHRDISSAIQLVSQGAQLHVLWKKPKRWQAFWEDNGTAEVLALDMVTDPFDLYRIISAISCSHTWAPARSWCMNCRSTLGTKTRALHCKHCSRLICGKCASNCLPPHLFPKFLNIQQASWACTVCEKILVSRKDEICSATQPSSSYGEDEGENLFSC